LAIAYPENGATGFSPRSHGDFERTYRSALRHSRHVRWLRISVPAGIAAILLVVVGLNYLPPIGGFRLPGELGNLVIHGTKITMQQPRLTGFTVDSRAYEFSADAAAQDITKPNLVELDKLHAKMEMQDKTSVDMSADSGVYDAKSEILTLKDNIVLNSSTGYQGQLSEAVIDVRKGNVVSDEPVSVKMLDGFLNAKRLDIAENGSVLRFGGVTMTIEPNKNSAKDSAKDPTQDSAKDSDNDSTKAAGQ
jgi:lipopolysaccharide export system protein LptC